MGTLSPRTLNTPAGLAIFIRPAQPADAQALLAFDAHIALTSPHNVTQLGERDRSLEEQIIWINESFSLDHQLAILAFAPGLPTGADIAKAMKGDDGTLVGLLTFRGHPRKRMAHHGHFGISVHQAVRGMGVGTLLISTLLDWAKAHPLIEKVCLGVFETNTAARRLYQRMGFIEECTRSREFKLEDGTYVNDIQMSQWVKP